MGKDLKGKELGSGLSQRKDGKYSARFLSKSGKRIEKHYDKVVDARKWLIEAKYNDEHSNIGCSSQMTLHTWYEYWFEKIKTPIIKEATQELYISQYNNHIKPILGSMVISDIKPMHCQTLLNNMGKEYKGSTIEVTKNLLHLIFQNAIENEILTINPVTKSVKNPNPVEKRERVLTIDEQIRFLEESKNFSHYDEYRFIINTGVRTGELIGLKWSDIDFRKKEIHINRTMRYKPSLNTFVTSTPKTKSGKRTIPMTQEVYDILKQHKLINNELKTKNMLYHDNVFLNKSGTLTTNPQYDGQLKYICKKIDIPQISMHTLRHTFGTRAVESGMDYKALQMIMGHSSLSMTMDLYVHVTEEQKILQMQKLEKHLLSGAELVRRKEA